MIARSAEAENVNIPIVDLTSPNAAKELLDAAVKYGFIFVKHVDELELTAKDVDAMFDTVGSRLYSCTLGQTLLCEMFS